MSEVEHTLNILLNEIVNTRKELRLVVEASEVNILLQFESLNEKLRKLESDYSELHHRVEYLEKISKTNNIAYIWVERPN